MFGKANQPSSVPGAPGENHLSGAANSWHTLRLDPVTGNVEGVE
jgi:hypothetical protein